MNLSQGKEAGIKILKLEIPPQNWELKNPDFVIPPLFEMLRDKAGIEKKKN